MTPECDSHHGPIGPGGPAGHGHAAGHAHPAPHTHSLGGLEGHRPKQRRALLYSMVLTIVVMIAEGIGGIVTGSLMLLSDAVHMLSHAVSLAISFGRNMPLVYNLFYENMPYFNRFRVPVMI